MAASSPDLAVAGAVFALRGITAPLPRPQPGRARHALGACMLASSIAILTTIGIVGSMLSEAIRFFQSVSPASFFFGTVWDPRFAGRRQRGDCRPVRPAAAAGRHALYRFRRHAVRRADRPVRRHLHGRICRPDGALASPSRCSKSSPASRPSSTASSRWSRSARSCAIFPPS